MSKRLTVTLSDEIYNALVEQAARDMRTISNELMYILDTRLVHTVPTFATPEEFNNFKRTSNREPNTNQ